MFNGLDFSHQRDLTIDHLVRKVEAYHPDADFTLLRKAFEFAQAAHAGQKRSSGEEYIIHPLNVAHTLVQLHMDMDSIIAGILHDVLEDCDVTPEVIETGFGKEIAQIVVGLTKISKINFKTSEESQAENFRKMVVAMAKDIRVIIVKLSDRMHNMRTLQYISEEKQKKIAQETLDIYVPLASRLGINSVKAELEDLCLRYLKSEFYYRLAEKVAMKKSERESYIMQTIEVMHDRLIEYGMRAEVKGRPKNFYSIYKKMTFRGVDFDQIQDMLAFRIIVTNITECYKCLGIIHSSFTPIPGRFKDYIAIPKVNNYQSLHTTVIGPQAERIEIQIRTHEMDEIAETGVAAHWKYKEGVVGKNTRLDWIQELLEFNKSVKNNNDFMSVIKNDLDVGGIFIFTPTGDVKELQDTSTILDFAYTIHTEVGNKCVGGKVNGKLVPLRHRLKSGDTVEILTSKSQTPSKDWINIVKSSRAKTKIKQWLLKEEREHLKVIGEELLEKTLRVFSTSIKSLKKKGHWEKLLEVARVKNEEDLFVVLASGKLPPQELISLSPFITESTSPETPATNEDKIQEIENLAKKLTHKAKQKSHRDNAVIVDGMDDLVIRMGRCCNPIPGDPIVGYVTRGRGITVHHASCDKASSGESEMGRSISVDWNPEFNFKHPVTIKVITHDKPGVLFRVSKNLNEMGVNIRSAVAKSMTDRKGSFIFEIEVKDYSELLRIINGVEALSEVIAVTRI